MNESAPLAFARLLGALDALDEALAVAAQEEWRRRLAPLLHEARGRFERDLADASPIGTIPLLDMRTQVQEAVRRLPYPAAAVAARHNLAAADDAVGRGFAAALGTLLDEIDASSGRMMDSGTTTRAGSTDWDPRAPAPAAPSSGSAAPVAPPLTETARPPMAAPPPAPAAPPPMPADRGVPPAAAAPRVGRSALPPTSAPARDANALPGSTIELFYGTNRRPVDPADPAKGYSAQRDEQVHHGTCEVFVPLSHRIGSTGSGWWGRLRDRLRGRQDDRLVLRRIDAAAPDAFWQRVRRKLAGAPADERAALVFVHGYNVSFEAAALRAAQIGFDLSIGGAMAFFSWPSQGSLGGYLADSATIEASEAAIGDFLEAFAARSGAETVHVIAHSMGNRGVLRAVNRLAERIQAGATPRFGQFLLAAADVDADTFRLLAGAYKRLARRTTLYVSSRDRAVEASRWLHSFDRAGLIPPVTIVPGIDTVNVTNVDLTALGHGYVGEARDVLGDMHSLLTEDAPPARRFGVREAHAAGGSTYWEIGA